MSSPGYVGNADVVRIAKQRPVWCWSHLEEAIRQDRHCHTSTALRAIKRAVRAGLIVHQGTAYQVAETADELLTAPYCYRRIDRRRFLQIMAEHPTWTHTHLMDEVCTRLDTTETTVAKSFRYGRDFGYITRLPDGQWALTPHCRDLLAKWGRLEGAEGFRFATYLSGHPKRGFKRWTGTPPE